VKKHSPDKTCCCVCEGQKEPDYFIFYYGPDYQYEYDEGTPAGYGDYVDSCGYDDLVGFVGAFTGEIKRPDTGYTCLCAYGYDYGECDEGYGYEYREDTNIDRCEFVGCAVVESGDGIVAHIDYSADWSGFPPGTFGGVTVDADGLPLPYTTASPGMGAGSCSGVEEPFTDYVFRNRFRWHGKAFHGRSEWVTVETSSTGTCENKMINVRVTITTNDQYLSLDAQAEDRQYMEVTHYLQPANCATGGTSTFDWWDTRSAWTNFGTPVDLEYLTYPEPVWRHSESVYDCLCDFRLLGQYYLTSRGFKASQGDCLMGSAFAPSQTVLVADPICYCIEILSFEWYTLNYGSGVDTTPGDCAEKYFFYSSIAFGRFDEVDAGSATICSVDLSGCIEDTYASYYDPTNTEAPDNQFILGNRLQGVVGVNGFALDAYDDDDVLLAPTEFAPGIYENELLITREIVYEGSQKCSKWMREPILMERTTTECQNNLKVRYKIGAGSDESEAVTLDVPALCCPDTAAIQFFRGEYGV